MKLCLTGILLLLSTTFVIGCSIQPVPVTDYSTIVRNLKQSGAIVEAEGNTEQPAWPELFSGISKAIKLDGENLVVWEYRNEATAKTESRFIKYNGNGFYRPPDASRPGTAGSADYTDYPYWYQTSRIIVLYVGRNQATLDLLNNLLGPYYAGRGRTPLPVTDYTTLIDNLLWYAGDIIVRVRGDAPFPGDNPQQPIFSGAGKRIELNSDNISVLEYNDEITATAEAKFISADGFTFTSENRTTIANISWIAPPHFYKAGRIIVLYVGENQETIDLLEALLGQQFAGG
ncbi:hypothetical protein ACFLVH_03145 [Chloroflexota bacterium]